MNVILAQAHPIQEVLPFYLAEFFKVHDNVSDPEDFFYSTYEYVGVR